MATTNRNKPERNGQQNAIRDYKDLRAWQLARRLVKQVYEVTRAFPREERFGLAQQIRRAAVSAPSNIAEGYGRGSLKDYIRFLQTARGSLYEIETQLLLAQDLGFVAEGQFRELVGAIGECVRVLQGTDKRPARKTGPERLSMHQRAPCCLLPVARCPLPVACCSLPGEEE